MYMAKNVALSNDVYTILERMKRPGESFSDVVKRLERKSAKHDWRDSVGVWEDDKNVEKVFDKILKDRHKISKRSVVKW